MREDSQIALNQCVWKCRAFFPDAALVYSRIYIAVDIRDLESIQTRRKALTPAESEENSVRLHRGRSNCSGFGVVVPAPPVLPPYCPVPPRNHLPHFQLGEIQIQLNYTISLATIIIIDCWKSPPHSVESFRGPFICVRLLLWFFMHIKFLSHNLVERNFNRFRSYFDYFCKKIISEDFRDHIVEQVGRFVAWYH